MKTEYVPYKEGDEIELYVASYDGNEIRLSKAVSGAGANKTDAIVELDDERNGNRSSFLPGEWAFVRVYVMPFGLEYDHQVTKGSATYLGSYEQTVTEEEVVVRDGRASVRYPLKTIVLEDWDGRAFTGPSWREGQRDLSWSVEEGCPGSARLLLTYTTQYDLWQVRALDEGEVILCLEDEQGRGRRSAYPSSPTRQGAA